VRPPLLTPLVQHQQALLLLLLLLLLLPALQAQA
jgi:hypothetical protein